MTEVLLTIGAIIGVVVVAAILTPLMYAIGGYFAGWVLMKVFPVAGQWVVTGMNCLCTETTLETLPAIGAALGFIGSFFKTTQSKAKGD